LSNLVFLILTFYGLFFDKKAEEKNCIQENFHNYFFDQSFYPQAQKKIA